MRFIFKEVNALILIKLIKRFAPSFISSTWFIAIDRLSFIFIGNIVIIDNKGLMRNAVLFRRIIITIDIFSMKLIEFINWILIVVYFVILCKGIQEIYLFEKVNWKTPMCKIVFISPDKHILRIFWLFWFFLLFCQKIRELFPELIHRNLLSFFWFIREFCVGIFTEDALMLWFWCFRHIWKKIIELFVLLVFQELWCLFRSSFLLNFKLVIG